MRREHGRHVDMPLPAQRDRKPRLPLVEVRNDRGGQLVRDVLAQEPRDEVPEHDRLVRLMVVRWGRDAREVPEVALPLVEEVVCAAGVEEQDARRALDEPSPVQDLDPARTHRLDSLFQGLVGGFLGLDLHRGGLVAEGTDEAVSVAEFGDGDGHLCLDDGVDTADCMRRGAVSSMSRTIEIGTGTKLGATDLY